MPYLDKTTLARESMRDPLWRSRTGTPRLWLELDGATILTSPLAAGTTFSVGYISSAAPMTTDASEPDVRIPEAHHRHLPLAALFLLFSKDGSGQDMAKANKFLNDFFQLIGAGSHVRSQDVPAGR